MADSSPPKRPFKICNSQRSEKKGIACSTLEELKSISRERFSLSNDCRVFLENDGTEVDNEEYFQFLPPQTLFMVTDTNGQWIREALDGFDLQRKFSNLSESQESFQDGDEVDSGVRNNELPSSLRRKILEDPVFFVSLSNDELDLIVETKELQHQLGCTESKTKFFQESCQQELDRRKDIKETTELLKICQKAIDRRQVQEDQLQPTKKLKT